MEGSGWRRKIRLTGGDHLSVTPVKKGVGVRAVHSAGRCGVFPGQGKRKASGATGRDRVWADGG